MYKLLISIFLCSCVSLSRHEKIKKKIEELEFEVMSCQADVTEFQRVMLKLEEEQLKNKMCKKKVHRCSLKINEMYEFLHNPIND